MSDLCVTRPDISVEHASAQQRKAADPAHTRMASANAGSGKTRVLVNRVSRILLQGGDPSDILCLTYTKAAAAEMQQRLFEELGDWSIASSQDLQQALEDLFGQSLPSLSPPLNLKLARQLFAKALETPEGLKVQTIHAFCERILSRFPIEAGILPGFTPLEDNDLTQLRKETRRQVLKDATQVEYKSLRSAIAVLSLAKADMGLEEYFTWMANSGEKIRLWQQSGGVEPLAKTLGVERGQSPEAIAAQGWRDTDRDSLALFLQAFSASKRTNDLINAQILREILAIEDSHKREAVNTDTRNNHIQADVEAEAFNRYSQIFLTQAGQIRARLGVKALGEAVLAALSQEAVRVMGIVQAMRGAKILQQTQAVYDIALHYSRLYQQKKFQMRGLDYNDQIILVRDLLSNKTVSDWVRYKLDGGIEHILIDEAQDTAPDQWAIIDALAEPFFQPSPDEDRLAPRTLFAVGDEKQSIYRFQGAVPEMFLDKFQQYLPMDGMGEVRMRMSFRSVQEVLDVVDHVLNAGGVLQDMFDIEAFPPGSDVISHPAWREDKGGVSLWPLVMRPKTIEDNAPWDTTPVDMMGGSDQREVLARNLAKKIRGWIDMGVTITDKTGQSRALHAGDILILVRSRGTVFNAIIRQMKLHNIAVAGADRLTLQDSLVVKDLLALTRFVLLPLDDLSLAELLKSPFFGFDDDALYQIAVDREASLWAALQQRDPQIAQILQSLIDLSRNRVPYDFYAECLERQSPTGGSFRKAIYARLGRQAEDALEAFLASAMEHHLNHVPSLQRFLQSFETNPVEIKREIDVGAQELRVMTVHGAKGLEAPIVILPDTTQTPTHKASMVPFHDGFVTKPAKKTCPEVLLPFLEAHATKEMQEYYRLLYVAMTRAQNYLIICGFDDGQNTSGLQQGSWYDRIDRVFDDLETTDQALGFGDDKARIYGQPLGPSPSDEGKTHIKTGARDVAVEDRSHQDLPNWLYQMAPEEAAPRQYVTPSHLLAQAKSEPKSELASEPAVRSPLQTRDKQRFMRLCRRCLP